MSIPVTFRRCLALAGLVIGRFQQASRMQRSTLEEIVARQPVLDGRPVVANVDFGHTDPRLTCPIGGTAVVKVGGAPALTITAH